MLTHSNRSAHSSRCAPSFPEQRFPLKPVEQRDHPAPLGDDQVVRLRQRAKASFPILVIQPRFLFNALVARHVQDHALQMIKLKISQIR